jgi:signal transduction histidine kinase/CheY-like chemotaxis protein
MPELFLQQVDRNDAIGGVISVTEGFRMMNRRITAARDLVEARARQLSIELGTPIRPGFEALAFKASRGIDDSYDLTYICKDGSRFPAAVSITALRDDYDELIGYLLIGADNSVRKQVELQLTDARAVAESANQAKSEFLSNMSHELRSPLNAILGFAQLLASDDTPQSDTQKESTSQILHAGWYLLDLINEILDLALIESGKLLLSLEPMSLDEVMLDCQTMIEPQAQKYQVKMDFRTPPSPGFVRADCTRVKQVLLNLLTNAIKYNRTGGTVVVDCTLRSPDRIRISVRDTGAGLAPDKLAQLFQPFNRLGQQAGGEEGTGIGLVMTKRLVELMGGVIGVESTVDVGSAFWVDLVRAPRPDFAAVAPALAPSQPTPATHGQTARTLLYVEDNPANLKLVEHLVARRENMRLLSATDATVGIALARAHLPEVILMDINLPGISGIRALRLLREDPLTRHIPVVAISANAMPHDIRKGLEAGFFRYLTKPIRVDAFMEALDVALEIARTGQPVKPPRPEDIS